MLWQDSVDAQANLSIAGLISVTIVLMRTLYKIRTP